MKRQGYLLGATIMAGIETVIMVLFLLLILALGNSPEFIEGFEQGYNSTGNTMMGFAIIRTLFVLLVIYSIVKFIFILLSYRKNSKGFIITAIVLSSLPVLNYLISTLMVPASIVMLIYEGVILGLLIAGLVNLKKFKDDNQNAGTLDSYNDISIEMDRY